MVDVGLFAVVFLVILLLITVEIVRGVRYRKHAQEQDAALHRLQSDVHALCAGAINISNHMTTLEQKIRRLSERHNQLELRDPMQQTYDHAIRLAQQGAGVNDLVERCGLTRGEAELLLRIHRVRRPEAASA